jgi:hypothetical protein
VSGGDKYLSSAPLRTLSLFAAIWACRHPSGGDSAISRCRRKAFLTSEITVIENATAAQISLFEPGRHGVPILG